jgi:hypothetical protein
MWDSMIKENIQAKEKPDTSFSVEYLDQWGVNEGVGRRERRDELIPVGPEHLKQNVLR